jgi:D-3-phosphoglycerate dehydrogenase / 2-oxoglutarate reductase
MSHTRVLVADPIAAAGIAALQEDPNLEVDARPGISREDLLRDAGTYGAIVVRSQTRIDAEVIARADKLRVIGRAGVGVDNIDVDAATARGVIVMNTPGGNTISTAEHAFTLMMAMARHIAHAHASVAAGRWERKKFEGTELCNKTLAVLGMGRIGSEFARRAMAFGMRVVAYDPFLSASRARLMRVDLAESLEDALGEADFITMHMPVTPETRHMLDAASLSRCKPGVRIVNCARGGLIDEAALLAALDDGRVAGVALDVFEAEPPAADHPLLRHPKVTLTPTWAPPPPRPRKTSASKSPKTSANTSPTAR